LNFYGEGYQNAVLASFPSERVHLNAVWCWVRVAEALDSNDLSEPYSLIDVGCVSADLQLQVIDLPLEVY